MASKEISFAIEVAFSEVLKLSLFNYKQSEEKHGCTERMRRSPKGSFEL